MKRYFADQSKFSDSKVMIEGDEFLHMKNVMRQKIVDTIAIFDGFGNEFEREIQQIGHVSNYLELELITANYY